MEDTATEINYSAQEILNSEELENRRTLGVLIDSQYESMVQRFNWMKDRVERTFDQDVALRQECRELEQQLGITTEEERTLEASLFIDMPFMQVATFRGDKHPEELFGLDAWKGWLDARLAMSQVDELSIDTIQEVHSLLAGGMPEPVRGNFRSRSAIGSDYTNVGSPIQLTDQQIRAISENPLLNVRLLDEGIKEGFIVYPTVDDPKSMEKSLQTLSPLRRTALAYGATTDKLVKVLLEENLEWYGQASQNLREEGTWRASHEDARLTPSELAAEFQRRIVSIHPFEDGNGRLSRLLMTWALEKHGQTPTILRRGEDDLFFSSKEWHQEVVEGQKRYGEAKKHLTKSRFTSAAQFLHGHQRLAYFDILYRPHAEPPEVDAPMRHKEYRTYLEGFEQAYGAFSDYAERRIWTNWRSDTEAKMGGLIPEEYVRLWGNTKPDVQRRVRDVFFNPDKKVFRGGVCDDIRDPRDLLNVFVGPTGFTSGYRPILLERASPVSIQNLQKPAIRNELESYNAVLLGDVKKNIQVDIEVPARYEQAVTERSAEDARLSRSVKFEEEHEKRRRDALNRGRYTEYELSVHTGGKAPELWVSSGVSTSIDEEASRSFLTTLSDTKTDTRRALMVTGTLPRQGIFYSPSLYSMPLTREFHPWEDDNADETLDRESEVVIMGGMDPNSIETVEMYDSSARNLLAIAHRNEKNHIVLIDLTTSEKSIYGFTRKGGLRLVGSKQLNEAQVQSLRKELGKGSTDYSHSYSSSSGYEDDEDNSYDNNENEEQPMLAQSTLAKLKDQHLFDDFDDDDEDESMYLGASTLAKLKAKPLFGDDDDQ